MPENSTLLSRLREKRAAIGAKKDIVIPIPGYDGELAVRYVWKAYEELARRGQQLAKVKDPTRRDLFAAADILIQLCGEFVVPNEDHDPSDPDSDPWKRWEPREEDESLPGELKDGDPVTYALGAADALGFSADTAREAVFGVFNGNDYAVMNTAMNLSAWLQNASEEVDSEFSGS